ncbi:MAG TPA: hypothetical protein VGD98_24755 [Ktedonobacteraceae bacterium]
MSQNPIGPDYNPYGVRPANPNYPPAAGPAYNTGQPPSRPNPAYGQPPSGPGFDYSQYAPPPPVPGPDPLPNSGPAYNLSAPPGMAGPYDQTVFSQHSGAYPSYPMPSNPGYGVHGSNPGVSSPQNYPVPPYAPPGLPNFSAPPPTPPPAKKHNMRMIVLALSAVLLIIAGVLSITLYNNHLTTVHNDHNETATAQTRAQQGTGTAQARATATINAAATATYVKTHYPFSSNLALDDPLKDNSGVSKYGWDIGSGCSFANGAYEATETKVHFILPCGAENTNFSNFTFEIQMTIRTGGTNAQGGIFFRANMSTDALYIFFLDTQGNYELDIRANSSGASTRTLSQGTVSNFHSGFYQVHTLGIVANGTQITVYVDQNQAAKTTDPTYSSGQIGVFADYGSSSTTIAYTNAKVWQL